MNKNTSTFYKVLKKFKFVSEIPQDICDHIYSNKKKSLKNTLKIVNEYNLPFGAVIFIYFLSRKFGLKISLFYCKVILISATVATIGSASYLTYHTVINNQKTKNNIEKPIKKIQSNLNEGNSTNFKLLTDSQSLKLIIFQIENSGIISPLYQNISEKIYKALSIGNKHGLVILESDNALKITAKNKLIGRIHKLGENYILTIRIIDSTNGSIKFSKTISFQENENLDQKIVELSKNIFSIDSIW